ncbi:MAG: Gfo/Idh/MocA family oxidoreductase [Rhizobiaceae bacterium]|nr:Gfo/Idh/MocA family oxidoreductase [Rhizobiaceae bacterium]
MSKHTSAINVAVIGAGLIGARHAKLLDALPQTELFAIVDPVNKPGSDGFGKQVSHFDSFQEFLERSAECDGAIIATPNHTHKDIAERCLSHGIACLVEKPLAANSDDAREILKASEASGKPVLVGHHRRHHKASQELKRLIEGGSLGSIVGAQVSWVLRKPDEYFAAGDWRTKAGGGPVWINLIHEIDLLRYFIGEIVEVSSMLSNSTRGTEAEDTGVISMRFENDAVCSAILSDASPSPWHFEGGSGENPNIAYTGQDGMRIFGTQASISFPSMSVWRHESAEGHWGTAITQHKPITDTTMDGEVALSKQLEHFVDVVKGNTQPLVSARDGLQSVRVVEAIHASAKINQSVSVDLM